MPCTEKQRRYYWHLRGSELKRRLTFRELGTLVGLEKRGCGKRRSKAKGRKKNTPKRGFKKCVLTMLMKTRVRKNLCLYKCLNEAIKTCK